MRVTELTGDFFVLISNLFKDRDCKQKIILLLLPVDTCTYYLSRTCGAERFRSQLNQISRSAHSVQRVREAHIPTYKAASLNRNT